MTREIEQRRCELIGIDDRRACLVFEYRFDLDLLAERPLQELRDIDDQLVDVGLLRLKWLLAGECQEMLGEIRAARGRIVDHPRDGRKLRLVLHGIGQNLDRAGDDGEEVIEIMRDAAGELADGFHFLGLPDPLLGRDLVGEIAHEPVEQEAVARLQRGHAQLRGKFPSVPPPDLDLAARFRHLVLPGA